jgi:hypothetical protein
MQAIQTEPQRQRAPQLIEAINPDDDWSGITNATARRKRQNRLNVRALRMAYLTYHWFGCD